jgi:hypothetical protein
MERVSFLLQCTSKEHAVPFGCGGRFVDVCGRKNKIRPYGRLKSK